MVPLTFQFLMVIILAQGIRCIPITFRKEVGIEDMGGATHILVAGRVAYPTILPRIAAFDR